jgi:hypothetical protein
LISSPASLAHAAVTPVRHLTPTTLIHTSSRTPLADAGAARMRHLTRGILTQTASPASFAHAGVTRRCLRVDGVRPSYGDVSCGSGRSRRSARAGGCRWR